MTINEATKLIDAITKLIASFVWPAQALFIVLQVLIQPQERRRLDISGDPDEVRRFCLAGHDRLYPVA
ncbi:MAG: hypothetical protein M3O15_01210 [Acidobacteriota bacterium]|nr:hypothetical protein [Acidobacteriota bacterium]